MDALIIRDVEVEGRRGVDVRVRDGRIVEIGARLTGRGRELDGRGGALIPGLIDHHIHLLATAAEADSVRLNDVRSPAELAARVRQAAAARPPATWVRAIGYHDSVAGTLTRDDLDRLAPDHPVRVQHQTGSLWMLNSRALAIVAVGESPPCVELDAAGRPTGRVWRGDAWLQERIGRIAPPLAPVGQRLASLGVTGVTDASASTDQKAAAVLAQAVRQGDLRLRMMLMSAGRLEPPEDDAFIVGPVKILLDDHNLPALDALVETIAQARAWRRAVAVHCVTAGELAMTLAAFEAAGSRPGDRIEHGGVIPVEAAAVLKRLKLTVVTQPGFVFERGDRYLADIDPAEHQDLYRCASLLAAGVPVAASSDAPYSSLDPWAAMQAAVRRRTRGGRPIGPGERVSPGTALGLMLGDFADPGGTQRRVAAGVNADLCLLKAPFLDALDALSADLVAATLTGGRIVYQAHGG